VNHLFNVAFPTAAIYSQPVVLYPKTVTMQKITPFLWFDNNLEEAINFYSTVFTNAKITNINPMSATFELEGQQFMALNGGPHFKFNEAVSFYVNVETQEEVDHYWNKLTADGGSEGRCGWLKDKFGLSWQIIPSILGKLMGDKDPVRSRKVVDAMLTMNKIDVKGLQQAYKS
jgi:predicted 3-demethylubiquinone-9 3-methyltransferase (glyoxalase superfamily)